MFESLTDKLQAVFDKLGSKGKLTEADVNAAMREVRLALLEADVNFKVVREFTTRVKERALGAEVLRSLTPAQQVIDILKAELDNTLALLGCLEDLLETSLPLGDLVEDAKAWERGVDELAREDDEIAEYVKALEETRDTTELPEASGEAIAREFERYLKRKEDEV